MARRGLIQPGEWLGSVGGTTSPTSGDHLGGGEASAYAVKGALAHWRNPLLSACLAVEPIDGSRAFGLGSGVVGPQMRLEQLQGCIRDPWRAVVTRSHAVMQPPVGAPILGVG